MGTDEEAGCQSCRSKNGEELRKPQQTQRDTRPQPIEYISPVQGKTARVSELLKNRDVRSSLKAGLQPLRFRGGPVALIRTPTGTGSKPQRANQAHALSASPDQNRTHRIRAGSQPPAPGRH